MEGKEKKLLWFYRSKGKKIHIDRNAHEKNPQLKRKRSEGD